MMVVSFAVCECEGGFVQAVHLPTSKCHYPFVGMYIILSMLLGSRSMENYHSIGWECSEQIHF